MLWRKGRKGAANAGVQCWTFHWSNTHKEKWANHKCSAQQIFPKWTSLCNQHPAQDTEHSWHLWDSSCHSQLPWDVGVTRAVDQIISRSLPPGCEVRLHFSAPCSEQPFICSGLRHVSRSDKHPSSRAPMMLCWLWDLPCRGASIRLGPKEIWWAELTPSGYIAWGQINLCGISHWE